MQQYSKVKINLELAKKKKKKVNWSKCASCCNTEAAGVTHICPTAFG